MTPVGSSDNPLRVAIIGAGPTGFYAAGHLQSQKDFVVEIDMFERLPTPYGLVRYGVAPDHQKIKSVEKIFERTAKKPGFRFFGNVEIGTDITVADLRNYYHQIIFTTGAQTDRPLNIPGAELANHHPATEFVAWYNGHPDFRDCQFDLTQEKVVVIGVGNVAVDVARILSRTPEELAETDIADYALEALRASNIKEVVVLGRRGPAQAAFTTPEIKELGELEGADILTLPEEAALDPLSERDLAENGDRATQRKVEIIQSYADRPRTGKPRQLIVRFLVSPTEFIGDEQGRVKGMTLVHNELYQTETGTLRPRATERTEYLEAGLVFRSIGYRGVPIPGVPFHERWGVIHNDTGRVTTVDTNEPVLGLYTAGWIKRGPSGVIGTNKPDALETVKLMLEDAGAGRILDPSQTDSAAIATLVKTRQKDYISFADWQTLNDIELARGEESGRVRVKFTDVTEMLAALDGREG